mgnify:CR=1 FL=1
MIDSLPMMKKLILVALVAAVLDRILRDQQTGPDWDHATVGTL